MRYRDRFLRSTIPLCRIANNKGDFRRVAQQQKCSAIRLRTLTARKRRVVGVLTDLKELYDLVNETTQWVRFTTEDAVKSLQNSVVATLHATILFVAGRNSVFGQRIATNRRQRQVLH